MDGIGHLRIVGADRRNDVIRWLERRLAWERRFRELAARTGAPHDAEPTRVRHPA